MSSSSDAQLTLAAVGQALVKHEILAGAGPATLALVSRLQAADAAFTNLEGAIAGRHGGWPMKDKAASALPPSVLDTLRTMGFGLLSLANNHAADLGPAGILSTLDEVTARGFTSAGIGVDAAAAATPGVGVFSGRRIGLVAIDAGPWGDHVWASPNRPGVNRLKVQRRLRVPPADFAVLSRIAEETGHQARITQRASLGFQQPPPESTLDFFGTRIEPGDGPEELMQPDEADLARHETVIAQAACTTDLLVAYLHNHHWPADMMAPPSWLPGVARRLLAAGADVFLSHGAPVLQAIELIDGKPAAYGLGNFIFHSGNTKVRHAEEVWRSALLTFSFHQRRLASLKVEAVSLGDAACHHLPDSDRSAPRLWTGRSATAYLERWIARGSLARAAWELSDGACTLRLGALA